MILFGEGGRADPIAATRAGATSRLEKRRYAGVAITEGEGLFAVTLDGKAALTPAGHPVAVPSAALAVALAAEWSGQGTLVDPATMPLSRIVASALDAVADRTEAVRDDVVRYAGTDLLCYRAASPERLVERQAAAWDPPLAWLRQVLGVRLRLAEGVVHVAQDPDALASFVAAVGKPRPLRLVALHSATTLMGSAVLAFAVGRGRLSAAEAWAAAHVDEDWQAELWGVDAEAADRRARRWREMEAAATILADPAC